MRISSLIAVFASSFAFGQPTSKVPETPKVEIPQFQIEREKAVGEKFDKFRTIKGKVYENVVVREVSDRGLLIMHPSGMARIPLSDLNYKLRKRFGYDPKKAQEEAKKYRETARRGDAAHAKAMAKKREIQKEKNLEYTKKEFLKKKQAKIGELESRILKLKSGIDKANTEIQEMRVKARDYRSRANS